MGFGKTYPKTLFQLGLKLQLLLELADPCGSTPKGDAPSPTTENFESPGAPTRVPAFRVKFPGRRLWGCEAFEGFRVYVGAV